MKKLMKSIMGKSVKRAIMIALISGALIPTVIFVENTVEAMMLTTEHQLTASPITSKVLVNGNAVSFDAYTINGSNYFKLRDIASAVSGTEKQFEVSWDNENRIINLISNKKYTEIGGELRKGDGVAKKPVLNTSKILKDDKEVGLTSYTIGENNYFKLRDLAQVFNIEVKWDGDTNTVEIETKTKEVEKVVEFYENPEVKTGGESLKLLKKGNARFVEGKLANYDLGKVKREELTKGQKPFAVVVACADSRVSPEHLFDQGLGDIFVIRVAGNILDKAEIGSIEYAVDHLGSQLVVVLGHESCGAVAAAFDKSVNPENSHTTENIDALLDNIAPAVEKAKESKLEGKELLEKVSELNVELSLEQLLKDSKLIKESLDKDGVKIIGAKYLLSTGEVKWFE